MNDFPDRQPDEKILMVIRKHPIVYIRNFAIFLAASVLPLSIFLSLWSQKFPFFNSGTIGIIGYLGASLYLLYSMALLMIAVLNDEFDLFILTDSRLIDITQVTLLNRTVAITQLNQIQDSTSDVSGVMQTLLNYGTINIRTAAGSASDFMIDNVSDPGLIARKILNQAEERREKEMSMRNHGV